MKNNLSIDGQLVLSSRATITCPKCANEFGLEQGFGKKALDRLLDASAGAIDAMKEAEREEAEKRAKVRANQKADAAKLEAQGLKKLLEDQAEAHAASLAQVQRLAA